jgi:streptogramin lyase
MSTYPQLSFPMMVQKLVAPRIGGGEDPLGRSTCIRRTAGSGPRRGMMDQEGRLWFGENRGDRIGMFDTRTEKFQEWIPPTKESWPYDVTADKNGDVWSGGEFTDTIQRLDPKTGEFIEYLLPRFTNVRRVFVDNSTSPVTFWVGNNHGASVVKLEPLN